jgi:pimeloyl-ACP methyl ester carboxylesterase
MGGRGAAYYAAKHAGRLEALVLLDWSPENAPEGSRRVAQTVANVPETFASVDDAMAYFGADAHSPAGAATRGRYEAYLRPTAGGFELKRSRHFGAQFRRQLDTGVRPAQEVDLWDVVRELRVPTLVVRGSRSDLFAEANVARMRAANPRIEFGEVQAGHHVAGDAPEATLAAVRSFIDSLETA